MKKSALGGQQVSSTTLGAVVLDTGEPAGTTCCPLTANFTVLQAVGYVMTSPGFERVEVHEVADVVGQEDGRAVDAGPDRLRVVPDRHVELWIVGALLDRSRQVDGGNAQDARQLPRLDAGHLARGAVALPRRSWPWRPARSATSTAWAWRWCAWWAKA